MIIDFCFVINTVSAQNFEYNDLYVTLELDLPKEGGWSVEEEEDNEEEEEDWAVETNDVAVTTQLCRAKSSDKVSKIVDS